MNSDETITPSRHRLNQLLQCPFHHGDRVQQVGQYFQVGEVVGLALCDDKLHLKIRLDSGGEIFGLPADWIEAIPF